MHWNLHPPFKIGLSTENHKSSNKEPNKKASARVRSPKKDKITYRSENVLQQKEKKNCSDNGMNEIKEEKKKIVMEMEPALSKAILHPIQWNQNAWPSQIAINIGAPQWRVHYAHSFFFFGLVRKKQKRKISTKNKKLNAVPKWMQEEKKEEL